MCQRVCFTRTITLQAPDQYKVSVILDFAHHVSGHERGLEFPAQKLCEVCILTVCTREQHFGKSSAKEGSEGKRSRRLFRYCEPHETLHLAHFLQSQLLLPFSDNWLTIALD